MGKEGGTEEEEGNSIFSNVNSKLKRYPQTKVTRKDCSLPHAPRLGYSPYSERQQVIPNAHVRGVRRDSPI